MARESGSEDLWDGCHRTVLMAVRRDGGVDYKRLVGDEISLSFCVLKEGPSSLAKAFNSHSDITKLILKDGRLERLPPEVQELRNLRSLTVTNNFLTDLPEELATLSRLQHLHLDGNQFRTIPRVAKKMPGLVCLRLLNNLVEDPGEFPNTWRHMKYLRVEGSGVQANLDPSISHLTNLIVLRVSNMNIPELPPSMAHLRKLERLDVSRNQLTHLPEFLFGFRHLKILRATRNRINRLIPLGFKGSLWSDLEELDLGYNRLKFLPRSLEHIHGLDIVDVQYNQLDSMPFNLMRQVTKGKCFYFGHNPMQAATSPVPDDPGRSPARLVDLAVLRLAAMKPDCQFEGMDLPLALVQALKSVRNCEVSSCFGNYYDCSRVQKYSREPSEGIEHPIVCKGRVPAFHCNDDEVFEFYLVERTVVGPRLTVEKMVCSTQCELYKPAHHLALPVGRLLLRHPESQR